MLVTIQLFANLREQLGESVQLDLSPPACVGDLRREFLNRYPQFRGMAASLNVALDLDYAEDEREIRPDQEIAIFPPVSGG